MTSLSIDIVICTYNRAADLDRTLDRLGSQRGTTGIAWSVLVVDNNSTDDTPAVVEAHCARGALTGLRRLLEPEQGLTPARRRGVRETQAPWVAFVDDDNLLEPDWLAAIAAVIAQHPDAGGIGGRVLIDWVVSPPAFLAGFGWCFAEQDYGPQPRAVENLAGAGMVLSRQALVASGWLERPLLEDRIGRRLVSGGDAEIAQRVRGTGWALRYSPDAVLRHRIGPERMTARYFLRINAGLGASEAMVSALGAANGLDGWRAGARASLKRKMRWAAFRLMGCRTRASLLQALGWGAYAWGLSRGMAYLEHLEPARRAELIGAAFRPHSRATRALTGEG